VYTGEEKVDLGIYNAFNQPVYTNEYLMCCYFNIGFEPRVGASKYLVNHIHNLF